MRAALVNSGFEFPLRRITVNLAPADLRKAGPGFDLALAAALLVASGQLPGERARHVRAVRRARARRPRAPGARRARDGGRRAPRRAARASWCRRRTRARPRCQAAIDVVAVELAPRPGRIPGGRRSPAGARGGCAARCCERTPDDGIDFAQVRGHHALKRALEVAAAGGHNVLMVGPPGSGKSMAARRLPSIMPPLTVDGGARGDAGPQRRGAARRRAAGRAASLPRAAPHRSRAPGLVGGGPTPSPGEASLAQHGVLFLDELAEFSRPALEALRQPLEEGSIRITRAQRTRHVSRPLHAGGGDEPVSVRARGRRRAANARARTRRSSATRRS